jgi:outer membrane lipoprotein SlyB
MKTSTIRTLWFAPLAIAGLGALVSACGPQDGNAVAASATPTPQAAATAPAAVVTQQAPAARPAPAAQPAVKHAAATKPAPSATPSPAKPAAVPPPAVHPVQTAAVRSDLVGAIQQIEPITQTDATGTGAVLGGVLGSVVGHQFGKGDGKKAMTVVGAVGGAVAGHEIEKQHNKKVVGYRVRVQLDNGETRTFEPPQLDGLKIGDRVRVDQGALRKA